MESSRPEPSQPESPFDSGAQSNQCIWKGVHICVVRIHGRVHVLVCIFVPLAFWTFLMLAAGMRFHHWYDIIWVSTGNASAESPDVHSDPGHS